MLTVRFFSLILLNIHQIQTITSKQTDDLGVCVLKLQTV